VYKRQIVATADAVQVGFELDGVRYAGTVRAGVLTTEEVDAFWMAGEWRPEVEIWGAV
jgi:hypothetical protein